MAKKSKRVLFRLECPVCKNQNYTTEKNADNITMKNKGQNVKLTFKKYCNHCRKTTEHKEVKI